MKYLFPFLFITLILSGCQEKYDFWDISKFNMKPGALENFEKIEVIYCSNAPDENEDDAYYVHLVVVSEKTGDTVNILSATNPNFKDGDGNKGYSYISSEDVAAQLMQLKPDEIQKIKNVKQLERLSSKKITKVAHDPEFDFIADNQFPTVIGEIGFVSVSE